MRCTKIWKDNMNKKMISIAAQQRTFFHAILHQGWLVRIELVVKLTLAFRNIVDFIVVGHSASWSWPCPFPNFVPKTNGVVSRSTIVLCSNLGGCAIVSHIRAKRSRCFKQHHFRFAVEFRSVLMDLSCGVRLCVGECKLTFLALITENNMTFLVLVRINGTAEVDIFSDSIELLRDLRACCVIRSVVTKHDRGLLATWWWGHVCQQATPQDHLMD